MIAAPPKRLLRQETQVLTHAAHDTRQSSLPASRMACVAATAPRAR